MYNLNFARVGGFHLLINFHEEPLGIIKLDASSREAGQDSENNFSAYTGCHKSERYFDKRSNE